MRVRIGSRRLRAVVAFAVAVACLLPVDAGVPHARAAIGCSVSDPGGPDLVAGSIEITQAIQDAQNRIPLIAGKRTYVRFYPNIFNLRDLPVAQRSGRADAQRVPLPTGSCVTDAVLRVRSGLTTTTLEPLNTDAVNTVTYQRANRFKRSEEGFGFTFELPSTATAGQSITIEAEVNPNGTIAEPRGNNVIQKTLTFRQVRPLDIEFDRLAYEVGGTNHTTNISEAAQLARWVQRAFPVPAVQWRSSSLDLGTVTVDRGNWTDPLCGGVNTRRLWRLIGFPPKLSEYFDMTRSNRRAYGIAHDAGGFLRGCTIDIPGAFASGPTGTPGTSHGAAWSWDDDGSYGDWYGGHELAHTYGREHVRCTGDEGGAISWPYPNGLISPQGSDANAIVGFDVETREVYGFDEGHDLMTYSNDGLGCTFQWVSDVNYTKLLDRFVAADPPPPPGPEGDNICVIGTLGRGKGSPDEARIEPIFHSSEPTPELAVGKKGKGKYAIVQEAADGSVLSRTKFKPIKAKPGSPSAGATAKVKPELLVIRCLPFEIGTTQVEVTGPGKVVLDSITPGAAEPTVDVLPPTGTGPSPAPTASPSPSAIPTASPSATPTPPVILLRDTHALADSNGPALRLQWNASDPDGDALTHMVQASTDGGSTWTTVALPTKQTSIEIPRDNLVGGDTRFRVVTTDGLNTTVDELEVAIPIIGVPPLLEIRSPTVSQRIRSKQTLSLEAFAYDLDSGNLDGSAVQWRSDKDGALGSGDQISVTGLSPGGHSITVTATSSLGGTTTRVVPIVVLPSA